MNPAMPSVMTGAGNLCDQRKQLHESIYAAMVGRATKEPHDPANCYRDLQTVEVGRAVKMIAPEGSRCQDDSKSSFQH